MIPAVQVEELLHRFGGRVALDGVTLTVAQGEIFGVFGFSGAGKSTLLRILAGQIVPTAGKAQVLGMDASADRDRLRRHIGHVAQAPVLSPEMTLSQNLRLVAGVHGLSFAEAQARFARLCERLGIDADEAARLPSGRLAQGVRRRAGVAFALLHRPEVLLIDEPAAGLDSHDQLRLWTLLKEAAAAGTTVFFGSSHPVEAERCGRLVLLGRGRVRLSGTAQEIRAGHVGAARVRLDGLDAQRAALARERLLALGYQVEAAGPRILLPDHGESSLRRLRAVLETLPFQPQVRLELPTLSQIFQEALGAEL